MIRPLPLRSLSAACLLLLAWLPGPLPAQSPQADPPREHTIFEGRSYDPSIPTPTQGLGYALGEDLATYYAMIPYLQSLAAASDRMVLERHGESYEGRGIYHAVITAPENLARLEEIRGNLARLADPRGLDAVEADAILAETPVVVMLNFATDGAETAGPESAVQVAYQLAAATDARTEALLREAVVVVIPAENPDSNQRTVAWYNAFRVGPEGTADPEAAEHHFPWGINSNNRYQIDMNRESVWSIQRETRAMVALYRAWNPQVFVDNHGQYPAYTGPWYAEPLHEQLTPEQRTWLRRFGEAMGDAFAEHGYRYSAWEFGQFDPGYWDTYPNFTGAIAWTTETTGGGNRGIRMQMPGGGPLFTLEDAVVQHVIASDLTVRFAAENREALLGHFLQYKRSAVEEGRPGPVRGYVLPATGDARRLNTVMENFQRNRIEVHRTTEPVRVSGARPHFRPGGDGTRPEGTVELPAGSLVLPMAQPESRLLRILMEPEARFSQEFLDQVEEERARAEARGETSRIFYDVTGWSMPLTYHLEAYEVAELPTATERVEAGAGSQGTVVNPGARHGFLVDYASNAAVDALVRFQKEGLLHRVVTEPLTIEGRRFSSGSLAVFHQENPGRDLRAIMTGLAEERGVTVVGVDGPISEEGPHLGSGRVAPVPRVRIAVVMDRPVHANTYGHIWYTFERRVGVGFTALPFSRLLGADLSAYDVLILPDGSYGSVHPGEAADVARRLAGWVEEGGRLIGLRGGAAWLAREDLGITSARLRPLPEGRVTGLPVVPGAILRARVTDPFHPLLLGYEDEEIPVMVWSSLALDPDARVESPIAIAGPDRSRVSGFAFPENLEHLSGSPYAVRDRRGRGAVILFLDDPNFRLYWDGLTRMFFNAVFFGSL
jgi:hypothetical protein